MLTIEQEEKIISLYKNNSVTLREIMTETGVRQTTILAVIRRNKIPMRGRKKYFDKEQYVVSEYQEGKSIRDIMRSTGIKSIHTIYRILKDMGAGKRRPNA